MDQDFIEEYRRIDAEKLGRRDKLGEKNFEGVLPILRRIKLLLDESLKIILEDKKIAEMFENTLAVKMREFMSYAKRVQDYNLDQDPNIRTQIHNDINQYEAAVFQDNSNNLLSVYNSIKLRKLK